MSTLVFEKDIGDLDNERSLLIRALRAALNAAEQGEDEVTIIANGMEITWQFADNEFFVIA
jgi:hypothetical protein